MGISPINRELHLWIVILFLSDLFAVTVAGHSVWCFVYEFLSEYFSGDIC